MSTVVQVCPRSGAWIVALSLFVACTARPAPPAIVSQSEMNLAMFQRVKDEGAARCGHNGGLKGVEWAYDTTPTGKMDPRAVVWEDPDPQKHASAAQWTVSEA